MGVWQHARRSHANLRKIRDRHPRFTDAVAEDVAATLRCRGEEEGTGAPLDTALHALRLMWSSDAFAAMVLYRAKAAMQRRGVPVLPRLCHHLSMALAQVCIGDPVLVHPGVYVPHGQIVLDGFTEIGPGVRLLPWVTIGLKEGSVVGPTIGSNSEIGTGAKVLGPVRVGSGSRVGAGAVVVHDVPDGSVAVGVPAASRPRQP
jgi:serine O-acetyltransferase